MHKLLKTYLSGFGSLNQEEVEEIGEKLVVDEFPKGTILLEAGQLSRKCYFVLKGCIRQYVLVDGEEKTTEFYTEHQSVVTFSSITNQEPSSNFLVCTEDSVLLVGDVSDEQDMYHEFPKLEQITRSMMEQDFGKSQEAFMRFKTSSPEERYKYLLETRSDLLKRVPLNQIASYLGIKPESLSRIRKRMFMK